MGATYDAASVTGTDIAERPEWVSFTGSRARSSHCSLLHSAARRPLPPPLPLPVPVSISIDDPVLVLIADSNRHFRLPAKGLERGHFGRPRRVQPRHRRAPGVAVGVALRSRACAAVRPPRRPHQRLRSESARRGRRLHRNTTRRRLTSCWRSRRPPERLCADARAEGRPQDGSRVHRARHRHSAQPARPLLHRAVPGPAPRLHRRRHEARQQCCR